MDGRRLSLRKHGCVPVKPSGPAWRFWRLDDPGQCGNSQPDRRIAIRPRLRKSRAISYKYQKHQAAAGLRVSSAEYGHTVLIVSSTSLGKARIAGAELMSSFIAPHAAGRFSENHCVYKQQGIPGLRIGCFALFTAYAGIRGGDNLSHTC